MYGSILSIRLSIFMNNFMRTLTMRNVPMVRKAIILIIISTATASNLFNFTWPRSCDKTYGTSQVVREKAANRMAPTIKLRIIILRF